MSFHFLCSNSPIKATISKHLRHSLDCRRQLKKKCLHYKWRLIISKVYSRWEITFTAVQFFCRTIVMIFNYYWKPLFCILNIVYWTFLKLVNCYFPHAWSWCIHIRTRNLFSTLEKNMRIRSTEMSSMLCRIQWYGFCRNHGFAMHFH